MLKNTFSKIIYFQFVSRIRYPGRIEDRLQPDISCHYQPILSQLRALSFTQVNYQPLLSQLRALSFTQVNYQPILS